MLNPVRSQTLNLCVILTCALFAVPLFSGCYLRPDLGPPGTIGAQRSRFVLNDPYPSNYLGPPIVGGRPRGFDLPLSEAQNHQVSPASNLNRANLGPFGRRRQNQQFGY